MICLDLLLVVRVLRALRGGSYAADVLAALWTLKDEVGARPAQYRMPARTQRDAVAHHAACTTPIIIQLEDSRQGRQAHKIAGRRTNRRQVGAAVPPVPADAFGQQWLLLMVLLLPPAHAVLHKAAETAKHGEYCHAGAVLQGEGAAWRRAERRCCRQPREVIRLKTRGDIQDSHP